MTLTTIFKKTLLYIITIFISLASATVSAKIELPGTWSGIISITEIQEAFSTDTLQEDGTIIYSWTIKPKLKESLTVNVIDHNEKTVGKIVFLKEIHSRWSVTGGGELVESNKCDITRNISHINDYGDKAITSAWIYYSLSAEDPLANILPNGSYQIYGDVKQLAYGKNYYSTTNCDKETQIKTVDTTIPLHFTINQLAHLEPPKDKKYFTVKEIGDFITKKTAIPFDPFTRQLTNGLMSGSYQSRLSPTPGFTKYVKWDLNKKIKIGCHLTSDNKVHPDKNTMKKTAFLDPDLGINGYFRFRLSEVSLQKQPNSISSDKDRFDITFLENQTNYTRPARLSDGWQIQSTKATQTATISIVTHNKEAQGKLHAEVNIGGDWYDCFTKSGEDFIELKKDP